MSIESALVSLQGADVLVPYMPQRTRRPARRRLFLTSKACRTLVNPESATNILCGRGPIEAAFTKWVLGDRVYGDRYRRFIRDLCPPPPEVWEIRVTEPIVQVRIIGRFPEPDTFIATELYTRNFLGDKGSQAWSEAMQDCEAQWNSFSPVLPVFCGRSIHDYIQENCDDIPIKVPCLRGKRSSQAGSRKLRGRATKRSNV